jgi:capsular exopolysaccharide synthesis family protein
MSDQVNRRSSGAVRQDMSDGPSSPSQRWTRAPEPVFQDIHLTDYLRVLYKRRWAAATVFVVVVLSVVVYAFTATPVFEARTRILIETDDQNIVSFSTVIDEVEAKADYYQTQYNILQSRALARQTLEELDLWSLPSFNKPPSWIARAAGLLQRGAADAGAQAADETIAQSRVVDEFLGNLDVSPIRNSRLVDIRYRLSDPVLASRIANAMAANYIAQNLEYKFTASKDASDWLAERLAEEKQQVEVAETALQQYRERNDAISLEDRQNIVVQRLADMNAAVTRAKTERLQKEALYRQLSASAGDPAALDTYPAILSNAFIQQQKAELAALQRQQAQMADRLGNRHPDMVKIQSAIAHAQEQIQTEVAKIVAAVRTEFESARAQEESMADALASQKTEALAMNRAAIEYSVLERDVESSKQIYNSLLQRAKETSVSGELKSSNIRVIDRAERPRRPVSPRPVFSLLLALVGGTILGCGTAFFFEYLDSRIKSPEEIDTYLGLPSIGMIPALGKQWKDADPLITNGVPPSFAEAFRTLRTNVLFSAATPGCRSIAVTSTGPGEGKTLVASNLAIGFATAGQRVLLLDADMRRPRLHDVLTGAQEPGLSNVLVGNTSAGDALRKTAVPNLYVLTAGRIPPNPAELLGSRAFKELLASIRERFDWIVIDTPPVMAVTDPNIVASLTDGVVFVIGAEMTSYRIARRALQQLEHAHAAFAGAVLNNVQIQRHAYYYSQYYRREYASYYAAAERS